MKLKREFYNENTLSEIGFEFRAEDPKPRLFDEVEFELVDRYVYPIGPSRRGQFYFLSIHPETLEIYVYAISGDGRGTHIIIGNVLLEMFEKGMVEK